MSDHGSGSGDDDVSTDILPPQESADDAASSDVFPDLETADDAASSDVFPDLEAADDTADDAASSDAFPDLDTADNAASSDYFPETESEEDVVISGVTSVPESDDDVVLARVVPVVESDDDVVLAGVRSAPDSDDEILITDANGAPIVAMVPIRVAGSHHVAHHRSGAPAPRLDEVIELNSDGEESVPKRLRQSPVAPSAAQRLSEERHRQEIVDTSKARLRCPLCLDPFQDMTSTACGHVYCRECISKAVEKIRMCPLCQRKLTKKDLHAIFL
ncbi:hypothetical protein ACHHYP_11843 [Achlya hypogyna]|uniref:RING-type domain-containing protein n=1 Tax=Achlya hypogyna TaxID=1202772 RepID=A0A1V9YI76_ACHHY|nr:hypothetical protein ACHHYP_11843 [Achlya hypogyna]